MNRSLEFSALPPHSLEKEEEIIIDHAYIMKPPQNPNNTGFGELPGG